MSKRRWKHSMRPEALKLNVLLWCMLLLSTESIECRLGARSLSVQARPENSFERVRSETRRFLSVCHTREDNIFVGRSSNQRAAEQTSRPFQRHPQPPLIRNPRTSRRRRPLIVHSHDPVVRSVLLSSRYPIVQCNARKVARLLFV